MAETAARAPLTTQFGKTWEEDFTLTNADGSGRDLTGLKARLQVRAVDEAYGDTGTPVIDLNSEDDPAEVSFATSAELGELCIVRLAIPPALVNLTNPDNARKVKDYVYGLELYDDSDPVERVVAVAEGTLTTLGSVNR